MDNSSILISVVIVLCIAAGVTAYGLTSDNNDVFNDLAGFTPDEQGNTGIGNNSTGLEGTDSGTGTGDGVTGTGSASSGSYSSSSSSSSSSTHHNISPERAKQIATNAGWEGSWCYSVEYNPGGYYTCLLKDKKGNTGYVLVGSGTGRILEGAWSNEVNPDEADDSDDKNDTEKSDTNKTSKKTSDDKKTSNKTSDKTSGKTNKTS